MEFADYDPLGAGATGSTGATGPALAATCESISNACPALLDILMTDQRNEQWKDDATWILTSSFVILTMQSGFGLLEIGSSTPGNEVNTMLKNVADILFGALSFYLVGYGIAYGSPSIPFMGLGDFLPDGSPDDGLDSGILYSKYLFQLSFAATSATIVSGCIAMRLKFEVYCAFAFYAVAVYAFVAHWVWADDGWLGTRGFYDFAGGAVVHFHGAMNGLVAILFVGPRRGRFDGTRPGSDFEESSPTSMLFGLFMLWWGWIGFNCGSTFGITDDKWLVAARAGVNTINCSAAGGIVAMIYSKIRSRKYRPTDIVNGILGSLVASSPTCASVHTHDALIVGAIGSLVALWTNDTLVKKWAKLDDPVGALGVHGAAGIWGTVAVALFADEHLPGVDLVSNGLFRGGGFQLLGIQLFGVFVIGCWSIVTMTPFFYVVGILLSRDCRNPRVGLRYDYDQMDPAIHGCSEDPTEKIDKEIQKALTERDRTQQMEARSRGFSSSGDDEFSHSHFSHDGSFFPYTEDQHLSRPRSSRPPPGSFFPYRGQIPNSSDHDHAHDDHSDESTDSMHDSVSSSASSTTRLKQYHCANTNISVSLTKEEAGDEAEVVSA